MNAKEAREKAAELINKMEYAVKDNVYRILWKERVKEDVEQQIEEMDIDNRYSRKFSDEEIAGIIDTAAERYVFGGDYDCNLSYWDNIENLINDECESLID